MPPNVRRTDGLSRRAIAAIGAPVALVAVAGALTLATPANAAGTGSNPLPFPTSVCGTSTATSGSGSASASASSSRSVTATPQTSASPTAKTTGKAVPATPSDPASSVSATPSTSAAAGSNGVPATPTPSPSPSAATSSSSSSSGGFWGWLNGVWTWIFGAAQMPHAAAAPAMNVAYVRTLANAHHAATAPTPTPTATATCVPKSAIKANTASSDGNVAAEIPWHLTSPSVTMYGLTYNGVTTIKTVNGSLQVLDFTAAKVTLLSMVTYSQQGGGKLQYVNGGVGQTVTLTNVHLWSTSFTADVLGLIHQTFTPQNPGLLTVLQGITVPLPLLFTNVEADNAFLNTQSIVIPGFDGHGN